MPFLQQNLLIVDDDEILLSLLERSMTEHFNSIQTANSLEKAEEQIDQFHFNKAILDLNIAGQSGLQLLKYLVHLQPNCDVIMLTGYSSIASAVEAIKVGAINYLTKPATPETILACFQTETEHLEGAVPQPERSLTEVDRMSVKRMEWEHIQKTLTEHGGNISATARALKMHRRTLQRKLQKKPVPK